MSLRTRLLLAMGIAVAGILLVSGAMDIVAGHRVRVAALRLRAKLVAKAQSAALANPIWEYDQQAGAAALEGALQDRELIEATCVDDTGAVFAHVANPELMKDPGGDPIVFKQPITLVVPTGETRSLGSVEARYSRNQLNRRLRTAIVWALGELVLLVLVVTFGMWLAIKRFTRPLEEMTEVIRSRARGDLSRDVRPSFLRRDDEIGAIAQSLEFDQQQRRDEAKLLEITSDISADAHVSEFLRRLAQAGEELLGAERCFVFVHDNAKNVLWSLSPAGRLEVRPGQGIVGSAFVSGAVFKIDDAQHDPRNDRDLDRVIDVITRTILCVPLVTKRGIHVGVFAALNRRGGPFTERDELRLRSLAAQAAVALENARLFDEVSDEKAYTESILGSLSDAVISLDPELRVAKVNAAAERLFGWRDGEVRAKPLRALLPGAENEFEHELLERVAKTGKPDSADDTDLKRPDGAVLTVNLNATPLANAKGESMGSLFVLEDITSEKRVRGTMARYLPKKVIDQLLEGDRAALGGTTQNITALFSDIRSFTTISEEIGARATVTMLNEYFTEMLEVIDRNNGVLDKFIGDAVMAIFGVPFAGEGDADNAVTAANEMIASLGRLNEVRKGRGQQAIAIGVGLNTGEAVAGNIGSPKRMSYTVIGDSVNLASRLEGATKQYGGSILLSEFTYAALKHKDHLRELDVIRVKGKSVPVAVYESFAWRADRDSDALRRAYDRSAHGLRAFRSRRFSEA
ncbi:MAG: PAS domain-containing protein, partial [Deltaproteobacteria bacterium]|nr:PAS domain-containing protein [Deltaproteobacteria bacterium]